MQITKVFVFFFFVNTENTHSLSQSKTTLT